jgi:hypothetical protein
VTLRVDTVEEVGQTLNISREGVFVRTPNPRRVGTIVTLRVALASGEAFEAEGVVVHANPDPDDPAATSSLRPRGMGVFLTSTTVGWRRLCDRLAAGTEGSAARHRPRGRPPVR